MEKDIFKTDVIFRIDNDNEVFALFPHVAETPDCVMSYASVGQHSAADYNHCMKKTKAASEQQYKDLYNELTQIGYNLKVVKRQNYDKYLASNKS